jgi:hypothetical protein
VILLDGDVLLIDQRYTNDPKFARNQQALQQIQADGLDLGITAQALLETVGILSFNTPPAQVPQLPQRLVTLFNLTVVPDFQQYPDYAGCTITELMTQMSSQMALGDAVLAVQIARYASSADCLLTWNARHFQGKLVIPVLTPEEWLNQRLGTTPTTP